MGPRVLWAAKFDEDVGSVLFSLSFIPLCFPRRSIMLPSYFLWGTTEYLQHSVLFLLPFALIAHWDRFAKGNLDGRKWEQIPFCVAKWILLT